MRDRSGVSVRPTRVLEFPVERRLSIRVTVRTERGAVRPTLLREVSVRVALPRGVVAVLLRSRMSVRPTLVLRGAVPRVEVARGVVTERVPLVLPVRPTLVLLGVVRGVVARGVVGVRPSAAGVRTDSPRLVVARFGVVL